MSEDGLSAIQFQAALLSLARANKLPELALELILQSQQNLNSDPAATTAQVKAPPPSEDIGQNIDILV